MSELGSWLDNLIQQQKQISMAGKSAQYAWKADPSIAKDAGMSDEEFNNAGARDKAVVVQGVFQKRVAKQTADENAAKIQLQQAQAQKAQMDVLASGGLGQFAQYMNEQMNNSAGPTGTTPTWPPPGGADWGALLNGQGPQGYPSQAAGTTTGNTSSNPPTMGQMALRALARVQAVNPRIGAAITKDVLPMVFQNSDDGGAVTFAEDPATGNRFASKGKVILPSGINPTKAMSGGTVPLTDTDGNVIGYNVPTGKGAFKPIMTTYLTENQKQVLIGQHMKDQDELLGQLPLAGTNAATVNAINDRIATHQDAIQKLRGGKGAASAPTAAGPPVIKSQSDYDALASGAVYTGADGKSYRKP